MLNVWDYGGNGPPLFLSHCTGTLARVWDSTVRALAGGFRCIAFDTRGHGDSEAPGTREDCAWILSGLDLLHVVDHFALEQPLYAAGHSAGGAHVGYACLARPGLFDRVMLIDSIIGPSAIFDQFENPMPGRVRRRVNVFPSREAARARLGSKPPMQLWVEEVFQNYLHFGMRDREDGQVELKLPGDREAWFYEMGGATDLFDALHTIDSPAMVVAGEHSDVPFLLELQSKALPNCTYRRVEGASHFVPLEKPAEVAALMLEFFGTQ